MTITWDCRNGIPDTVYNSAGNKFAVTRAGVSHAGVNVFEVMPSGQPDATPRTVRACDVTATSPTRAEESAAR